MNLFTPYLTQIKIAVFLIAFLSWSWMVYNISTDRERAKWERLELAKKQEALEDLKRSEKISVDAGAQYERERIVIQRVLVTPDRKLDETIQSPVGDVVIPGDLGMRLNAISSATSSSPSSSESDIRVPAAASVPDH